MKLNLVEFFDIIEKIPYILVKIDAPYVPASFPRSYAVGKDLDIITYREKLEFTKWVINIFVDRYRDKFEVIEIDEEDGFRIRFQKNNKLHFQIDVSCGVKGVSDSFVNSSIENRKQVGCYFVAEEKYEIIYRYFYYQKKKKKVYHLNYIRKHMDKADDALLKEVGISLDEIN